MYLACNFVCFYTTFWAIFAIVWWILSMIPIPPQFAWIVRVIVGVLFLIVVLDMLLGGGLGTHLGCIGRLC